MKEISYTLAEGVELTSITEQKFKTTNISIVMLMPCQPEQFAAWALVPSLLLNSCEKYPSIAKMTERTQELYGAYLDSGISLTANTWEMRLSIASISDAYAFDGEKVREEIAKLLLECILHPNLEGEKAFSEAAFQTEQREVLEIIENEVNNKRSYALRKAKRVIFSGESTAYPLYGTKEEVLALTPEAVYEAYQEILQKAQILIYYVGADNAPELPEMFRQAFSARKAPELCVISDSSCKEEPAVVKEEMEVSQSQLIMAFKSEEIQSREAFRMCSLMFGGAPFSLLFKNVREKMSLCYYCSTGLVFGKNAILVKSGVSQENIEKARQAITEQLEVIQKGEFDDKLLADAQRYLTNALKLTGDTPTSYISEALDKFIRPDHADTAELIRLYENLTKEDIIREAKALRLDTVYVLTQKGED